MCLKLVFSSRYATPPHTIIHTLSLTHTRIYMHVGFGVPAEYNISQSHILKINFFRTFILFMLVHIPHTGLDQHTHTQTNIWTPPHIWFMSHWPQYKRLMAQPLWQIVTSRDDTKRGWTQCASWLGVCIGTFIGVLHECVHVCVCAPHYG